MEDKSWVTGLILVLVIAVIAASMFIWNNKKQSDEADDYGRRVIEAQKAKRLKTTPSAPATSGSPTPTTPR